jgi:hypothetical protein
MASGDLNYSAGAFLSGETVNLKAKDVTPELPLIDLAKSAVVAANGSAAFTAVGRTMTQHGATVPLYAVAVGATSGRQIGALSEP